MDKTLINEYKKRVSSATPLELTNISFELFEYYANEALLYDRNSAEFQKYTKKSRDFIVMLNDTLDHKYEVSERLSQIYKYIITVLNDACENNEPIFINDSLRVIKPLKTAFKDIEKDGYGSLNKNTLSTDVFAGITYGKNGLNEFIDDVGKGRSFSG